GAAVAVKVGDRQRAGIDPGVERRGLDLAQLAGLDHAIEAALADRAAAAGLLAEIVVAVVVGVAEAAEALAVIDVDEPTEADRERASAEPSKGEVLGRQGADQSSHSRRQGVERLGQRPQTCQHQPPDVPRLLRIPLSGLAFLVFYGGA